MGCSIMNIEKIKQDLFFAVRNYNIPNEQLQKIFDISISHENDEKKVKNKFYRQLDNYIIKNIENEKYRNMLQEKLSYLKVLLLNNIKDDEISDNIDNIYESAFKVALDAYDYTGNFDILVYITMKRLIARANSKYDLKRSNEYKESSYIEDEYTYHNKKSRSNKISSDSKNDEPKLIKKENISNEEKEEIRNLLNIYLINNSITKAEFASQISVDSSILCKLLTGKQKFTNKNIKKIYGYFKVRSASELIIKLKEENKDFNLDDIEKLRDLLNIYLINNSITKIEFASVVSIEKSKLINFLTGKKFISQNNMRKIYKCFNVSSTSELIIKLKEENKDFRLNGLEEIQKLLNIYLINNSISQKDFASQINVDSTTLCKFLSGNVEKLLQDNMRKIYKYFKVNTASELIVKLKEEIINFYLYNVEHIKPNTKLDNNENLLEKENDSKKYSLKINN